MQKSHETIRIIPFAWSDIIPQYKIKSPRQIEIEIREYKLKEIIREYGINCIDNRHRTDIITFLLENHYSIGNISINTIDFLLSYSEITKNAGVYFARRGFEYTQSSEIDKNTLLITFLRYLSDNFNEHLETIDKYVYFIHRLLLHPSFGLSGAIIKIGVNKRKNVIKKTNIKAPNLYEYLNLVSKWEGDIGSTIAFIILDNQKMKDESLLDICMKKIYKK